MAKDFLGQELNVGDKVVRLCRLGNSIVLRKGVIREIPPKDRFGRELVTVDYCNHESNKTVVKVDY